MTLSVETLHILINVLTSFFSSHFYNGEKNELRLKEKNELGTVGGKKQRIRYI